MTPRPLEIGRAQGRTGYRGCELDQPTNWVWLPRWGLDKITVDGREQLRSLGFNV